MRLAAMMGVPVIYVFTHDSIGLGEDGPTHQPIEHLMSLRAIPNLCLFRPADAYETTAGWLMRSVVAGALDAQPPTTTPSPARYARRIIREAISHSGARATSPCAPGGVNTCDRRVV